MSHTEKPVQEFVSIYVYKWHYIIDFILVHNHFTVVRNIFRTGENIINLLYVFYI